MMMMHLQQPARQQLQQQQPSQQPTPSEVVNVRVSLSDITKRVAAENVTTAATAAESATKQKNSTAATAGECSVVKVKDDISVESRRVVDSLNDLKKRMFVMKARAAKDDLSSQPPLRDLPAVTASRKSSAPAQQAHAQPRQQRLGGGRAKSRSKSRVQKQEKANAVTTRQPVERKKKKKQAQAARPRRTVRQATKKRSIAPRSGVERHQRTSNNALREVPRPTNPVAVQQCSAQAEPPAITSSCMSDDTISNCQPKTRRAAPMMPSTTPLPARQNKGRAKRHSDVRHTAIKLIDTPGAAPQADSHTVESTTGTTTTAPEQNNLSAVPLLSPAAKYYLPSKAEGSSAAPPPPPPPGQHSFSFDDIASRFQNSIAALRKPAPLQNFAGVVSFAAGGVGAPVSPSAFSPHPLPTQREEEEEEEEEEEASPFTLPGPAAQASSRTNNPGQDQSSHTQIFASSDDQIAQLQKKIDAAATSKQFLRAAMLHAQLQQLTAVAKSNGGLGQTPTPASSHRREQDEECDGSSSSSSDVDDELATPNLTLLGVRSPLFTPNVLTTQAAGGRGTRNGATECNNTILMASPAELPVGDDDNDDDDGASCVVPEKANHHMVQRQQRHHVTFALLPGPPGDRTSECSADHCVDGRSPPKQPEDDDDDDRQSDGFFSVQKFLSDNSVSFEDKIKTLSKRLRDFKQRHADQKHQHRSQGGLFGYGSNANVMNQPIADEGERLRLAQQMVEDYLHGRIPPPPQFDAPDHHV